jgi:diguanylate cyclase (GGDEF)-like protein
VANELKMTIDMDDINLLGVEKQSLISRDPLFYLEIQVCSPIIYERKVHGLIALSGIPKYSRQKKVLINMISDLMASSLTNSMLFSQYRHMASRDALTDLENKRGFESAMLRALVKASRENGTFSVFIFDIDFFKKYNDASGHQAGDEALKITAQLLKENFRNGDVKARYGGEEFIVLMRETRKKQAYKLAEKFRENVERYPYPHEEKQPEGKLTISGGVATYPADGTNSKEIIEKADEALYEAKKSGRNKIVKARSFDFADYEVDGEVSSS